MKKDALCPFFVWIYFPWWEEEGSTSTTRGCCQCGNGKVNKAVGPVHHLCAITKWKKQRARKWEPGWRPPCCPLAVVRSSLQISSITAAAVPVSATGQELLEFFFICCNWNFSGVLIKPPLRTAFKSRRNFLVRPRENEKQPDKKGMNSQCEQQRPNSLLVLLETRCMNSPSW